MPRGTLLALAACLGLAACGSAVPAPGYDPVPRPSPVRANGWQPVAIDGTVRSIVGINSESPPPHLYAAGVAGGDPLLVDVTDGEWRHLDIRIADRFDGHGLRGLSSDGLNIAAAGATPPSSGTSAKLWAGDWWGTRWTESPRDRQGRSPVWLDPLLDGEEDFRSIGVVKVGDGWRLHAWEALDEWMPIDPGPQLHLTKAPADTTLITGTTETTVVAAGAICEGADAPPGPPQVWTLYSTAYEVGRPASWQRRPLRPEPDGLTDVADWDVGFWVAGHVDGHPVVYDFDSGDGAASVLRDVVLDEEHPRVSIARGFDGERVLAVQTEKGPRVLFETPAGWHELAGPDGRLEAAALVADLVYLLVDGRVWWHGRPSAAVSERP